MVRTAEVHSTTSSLDEQLVWQEITRIARAALREATPDTDAPPARLRGRVRGPSHSGDAWDVRAQSLLQAAHGHPVVVVAVERLPGIASVDDVRNRFGLSPRQAEVAVLLADRLSDKEIAIRLSISRHTARRHVELVMIRLRVHSRMEVAEVLAQSGSAKPRLAATSM
ncbi:MAG TPA: helix-turn-helix transcriptional regulator [Longimicrobiales bacterium]|nr:helix-turn-helix transcriptional regulator [Longimicrobiales bacterium]